MRHPFENIPATWSTPALVAGAVVTFGLGVVLLLVLKQGPGLGGLASLVSAGTSDRAAEVLAAWTDADRVRVGFIGGLDFLFGLAWTNTIALACIKSSRLTGRAGFVAMAALMAWLLWLALALDVPENLAYLNMALGHTQSPWPQMAVLALYPRVVTFVVAGLFVAVSLVVWRLKSDERSSREDR